MLSSTRVAMPRNAEVIRQWQLLRTLERARLGATIDELARASQVTTRTIRRDLAALAEAGFPLFDQRIEGRTRWHLHSAALGGLTATGFTLTEAAALYFSRALVTQSALGLLGPDLETAFEKFSEALAPVRRFLDQLPRVLVAKVGGHFASGATNDKVVPRLLDAILHHTRADMIYRSRSSQRERTYRIEPARLLSAEHELYLLAFVPEYQARRTFAVSRIRHVVPLDEHFTPGEDDWDSIFEHSLGVHEGPPTRVRIWFSPQIADYIAEREWHRSQRLERARDGSVSLTLSVSLDWSLRRWILGFGAQALVVEPQSLVQEIRRELELLRSRYGGSDGDGGDDGGGATTAPAATPKRPTRSKAGIPARARRRRTPRKTRLT